MHTCFPSRAARETASRMPSMDFWLQLPSESCQRLRWFLLPSEARNVLVVLKRMAVPCPDRLNINKYRAYTKDKIVREWQAC